MDANELAYLIGGAILDAEENDDSFDGALVHSFEDAMVLTDDEGFVLSLPDKKFHIIIKEV